MPAHKKLLSFETFMKKCSCLLPLVLVGCQTTGVFDGKPAPYSIPAGSLLVLHQQLTVPARRWYVYFQDGKVTSFGEVDEYLPYCKLEVNGPEQGDQLIEPGVFEVIKVRDEVDSRLASPVHVAASGDYLAGLIDRQFAHYETRVYLSSDTQPHVSQLVCGHLDEVGTGLFLSLPVIKKTLGNIITITTPTRDN